MTAAALAVLLVLATLFLAYANGSNDNLKGMATVIGSNTLSYKSALVLATLTTFAGSLASVFLAAGLFSQGSPVGGVGFVYLAILAFFLLPFDTADFFNEEVDHLLRSHLSQMELERHDDPGATVDAPEEHAHPVFRCFRETEIPEEHFPVKAPSLTEEGGPEG